MDASKTGTLVVEKTRGRRGEQQLFYAAKWRASLDKRQMKQRGPGGAAVQPAMSTSVHVDPDDDQSFELWTALGDLAADLPANGC